MVVMPMAVSNIKRPCRKVGCSALVVNGGFCDKHKQGYERLRGTPTQRGYNARWQRASKLFLKDNPICIRCERPAQVVDHIIPHRGNREFFWDINNWQPLCKHCHDTKTATEDKYF